MSREQQVVDRTRRAFRTGRSRPLEFRIQQLKRLWSFIKERQEEICEALRRDLGKSELGSELYELLVLEAELKLAISRLAEWAAPRPVEKNLLTLTAEVYVKPEPLGVVLIIGTWNYPWPLTLLPLVGAIAAGNAAIIKPSEVSSNSSKVMEEHLCHYIDQALYCPSPILSDGPADPICSHPCPSVSRSSAACCSEGLVQITGGACLPLRSPKTLELSAPPCALTEHPLSALLTRRITWGKFINCGQTCIAPDYILCESSIQTRVLEEIKKCIQEFFQGDPKNSSDYGRIINQRQFDRLVGLMEGSVVALGGDVDESQFYIGPTVLKNVTGDSRVMTEEIFGPLLPIVTVSGLEEAIQFINDREKPLVLYVFSNDQKLIQRVMSETSSGALLANDCMVHFIDNALPFGGVGHSGLGRYRGRHSFDQLSNLRSCMVKRLHLEGVNSMRYPPHTARRLGWARFFLLTHINTLGLYFLLAMLAGLAALMVQVKSC
ncbi:fatty aldehyde dehydrogenase-like, partial [Nothobranchius furzeri]